MFFSNLSKLKNCNNNNLICKNCNINNMNGGGTECKSCKDQRIGFNQNINKEEESLLKYGYSINDSYENRIKALNNAINNESKVKILRHINALRILQKSNKKIFNKLNKDIEFIEKI